MKNLLVFTTIMLFLAVSVPIAQADTLPLALECEELNSTDMSTQMVYEIDSRIEGVTASDATKKLWVTRGDGSSGWERSITVWTENGTAPLDFTGVSPWNSNSGYFAGAGTLISPRHIALAYHALIPTGQTLVFVDNSNNIITRTITDQARVGSTDLQIALLDSDVPAGITYYPIIDQSALEDYWKTFASTPLIVLDQEKKALIKNATSISSSNFNHTTPSSPRSDFNETLIVGDSGNPLFVVVGGRLVFVSTVYSLSAGPFTSNLADSINTIMTSLGGGYQISPLDLSCFTAQSVPAFSAESYDLSVAEDSANESVVGTVTAAGGSDTAYSFTAGNTGSVFAVNATTGEITVNDASLLDPEDTDLYTLTLLANADNSAWYWPTPGSDSATVNITVTDADEMIEFSADSYTFNISENVSTGALVGSVSAFDPEAEATVAYAITAGNINNAFAIDSSTGAITVADASYIDYDENNSYDLTVQATDDSEEPVSITVPVIVNVTVGDRPVAIFSANNSSHNENGGTINVEVSLDSAYAKDVVLTIDHEVMTAVLDTDFSLGASVVTIPAGSISGNFPVTLIHNSDSAADKIFTLTIDEAEKATIGSPSSHTLTITNIDSRGGGGGGGGSSGGHSKLNNSLTHPLAPGAGCKVGFLFSTVTGLSCPASPAPVLCQPGWLFNTTTGERCNAGAAFTTATSAASTSTAAGATAVTNSTATTLVATTTTVAATTIHNIPTTTAYAFGTTLVKLGTKGEACKAWQMFLNDKADAALVIDGRCGAKTIMAAKAWQASVGLIADGFLGSLSRAKALIH